MAMSAFHEHHHQRDGRGRFIDPSIGLFVSLYLILLAFFIVMNVISNRETARSVAVVQSLEDAFERPFGPPVRRPGLLPPDRYAQSDSEFFRLAGALISEMPGLVRSYPAEGGNMLVFEMDARAIFFAQSAELSEQATAFFQKISTLIKSAPYGEKREIAFIFGQAKAEGDLAYRRANALALSLVGQGIPQSSLAIGLDKKAPGRRLKIHLRANQPALESGRGAQ
jgi:hypothetical protein